MAEKTSCENILIATPFGYIALEAGWTVTEVGRIALDYLWNYENS